MRLCFCNLVFLYFESCSTNSWIMNWTNVECIIFSLLPAISINVGIATHILYSPPTCISRGQYLRIQSRQKSQATRWLSCLSLPLFPELLLGPLGLLSWTLTTTSAGSAYVHISIATECLWKMAICNFLVRAVYYNIHNIHVHDWNCIITQWI